jgi:DNA-binding transcriptional MerR regulator
MTLKIGALAERTGANAPTIRFYEEIGLLPRPNREAGGQRRYGEDDVRRLTFIRRCRDFGFSIEQVRALIALMRDPGRSCLEARDLAHDHLAAVRAKLAELEALERSLTYFLVSCEALCAGGPATDCVVLEGLASPARDEAPFRERRARP